MAIVLLERDSFALMNPLECDIDIVFAFSVPYALRRDMLRELGKKVERIKQVNVLLEVLGVGGMKEYAPLERFLADFLEQHGKACDESAKLP